MPSLPVTTRYLALIRAGRKTSTIRAWATCRVQPGASLTFTNYREHIRARCVRVDHVAVDALTDTDAQTDGFASRVELLAALHRHYAALPTHVWIVRFALLNDSDQSAFALD